MFGREYFGRGASPVALSVAGPQFDRELLTQLLRVSTPLIARRVSQGLATFPLLAITASFGSATVAALEVGRRVRNIANSTSWGLSIASSTLVGQELGAGEESEATAYGTQIITLAAVVHLFVAAGVILLAEPIATIFVDDPAAVALSATFIAVSAVSLVAMGVDGSATGALRGAGDTRIPFYASLIGLYVFTLPVAYLGTVTALGETALYVALVLETGVPAAVTLWRFRTGKWRAVSRDYRPGEA
jgi:Na+-driven multidrug efflux pump